MESISIEGPEGPLDVSIQLPRSKSVSNRALVMASLMGDTSLISGLSDGDDTRIMAELLHERPYRMDCGAGGTTFRFLMAWASVQEGEEHLLTGIPRLLERPHGDLVEALKTLGADIEAVSDGFRVRGRRMKGGPVHFESPISSQYLSALLLVAPCFSEGLDLKWSGTRLSEPFVHMTLKLLDHFGVRPSLTLDGVRVPPGAYHPRPYEVPADWSSAAFWFEQVALKEGSVVELPGLSMEPMQGDREAAKLWEPWVLVESTSDGVRLSHRADAHSPPQLPIDLKQVPDLFQPLAFTMAARGERVAFTGLDNLRVKETDRLKAVAEALTRFGCTAGHQGGTFILGGPVTELGAQTFDPDVDHRMALALAPMALLVERITIQDPGVVNKSYPQYWKDLERAGYRIG